MDELLRMQVVSSDDVAAVRQLTRDVAHEAGLAGLEQTKLATAASELARRSLAALGTGEAVFWLDTAGIRPRLVVAVSSPGLEAAPEQVVPGRRHLAAEARGLDLRSLQGLVDSLEVVAGSGGDRWALASIMVPTASAPDLHSLARRVARLRPHVSPEVLERRNVELADALTLLEAQSEQLAAANAELQRVNAEREAVNNELELTNRGVLDLYRELEQRAEELAATNQSLAASVTAHRQLAEQQSALADIGRLSIASHDSGLLAQKVVDTLRGVLGIAACSVIRLARGSKLVVMAAGGCDPGPTIRVGPRQLRSIRAGKTVVADLRAAGAHFPLHAPPGSLSGAIVPIQTPAGLWGVLAACDVHPDRFTRTATTFMEAAASLLAFAVARTAAEDATQYAALHDALTGLPNRAGLLSQTAAAQEGRASPASPQTLAAIFVDLDGFKEVNDSLGHAAGDRILVQSAQRLRRNTRPGDTLARLGGDEFVVYCQVPDEAAAAAIARRLLEGFDAPFAVEGRDIFLSASAGFALSDPERGAAQILEDADLAMYSAKQVSGSAAVAFRPEMRGLADLENRMHSDLRRARERGELRAVYQPIVDLDNGWVRGVEALVRWRSPHLGDVPADRLVAVAAHIGFLVELTNFMLQEGAGVVAAWNASHPDHPPLRLAVNFTAGLLNHPSRVDELQSCAEAAGLAFHLLDIELTETAFADPTPAFLASIAELRRRGARLSMDDFGTGYSSMLTLANLPFDILKIDRSFVTPLDRGGDPLLVTAMTGIARGRKLEIVGEGIETEGQLRALIAAECDLGQGYLFAQPLEQDELSSLLACEQACVATVTQAHRSALGSFRGAVPHAAGSPRARVLVVEDNPADVELLRGLLDAGGHDMVEVDGNPVAFLAALRDVQPDLVLMDLHLRGTSGFEIIERAEGMLTMPIVAVTGYPDWVLDGDARARRFTSVISKPVEPSALMKRVDGLLAGRVPHRSGAASGPAPVA